MITYKLNSIGDCANRIVDGVSIGEWHHVSYSQTFKNEINADEAQLEDADGVLMSPEQAKAYVATLP